MFSYKFSKTLLEAARKCNILSLKIPTGVNTHQRQMFCFYAFMRCISVNLQNALGM